MSACISRATPRGCSLSLYVCLSGREKLAREGQFSLPCHPEPLSVGEREPALSERSESNGDLGAPCECFAFFAKQQNRTSWRAALLAN